MTSPIVQSLTDELIAELEQLAGKATGGDWEYRLGLVRTLPDADGYVPVAVAPDSPKNWRGQRDTNMQYIAAAKPDVLRALLSERAALKADAERWRYARDIFHPEEVRECHQARMHFAVRPSSDLSTEVDQAIDTAIQEYNK